jgi:hypothetical protein
MISVHAAAVGELYASGAPTGNDDMAHRNTSENRDARGRSSPIEKPLGRRSATRR